MTTDRDRPLLKYNRRCWALSNTGILWGTYSTRRAAIKEAEGICGEPWKKIRNYMEVRKVTVVEGWDD